MWSSLCRWRVRKYAAIPRPGHPGLKRGGGAGGRDAGAALHRRRAGCPGDQRGRTIGVPTANLTGLNATAGKYRDAPYRQRAGTPGGEATCSIFLAPEKRGTSTASQALPAAAAEQRFDSFDALVAQIQQDSAQADSLQQSMELELSPGDTFCLYIGNALLLAGCSQQPLLVVEVTPVAVSANQWALTGACFHPLPPKSGPDSPGRGAVSFARWRRQPMRCMSAATGNRSYGVMQANANVRTPSQRWMVAGWAVPKCFSRAHRRAIQPGPGAPLPLSPAGWKQKPATAVGYTGRYSAPLCQLCAICHGVVQNGELKVTNYASLLARAASGCSGRAQQTGRVLPLVSGLSRGDASGRGRPGRTNNLSTTGFAAAKKVGPEHRSRMKSGCASAPPTTTPRPTNAMSRIAHPNHLSTVHSSVLPVVWLAPQPPVWPTICPAPSRMAGGMWTKLSRG